MERRGEGRRKDGILRTYRKFSHLLVFTVKSKSMSKFEEMNAASGSE
jgi:hypothetical protein